MTTNSSAEAGVYGVALTLLRDAVAAIDSGKDVAPAQRLRIEALLEQALREQIVDVGRMLATAQALLPANANLHVVDSGRVELALWQQRAPVVPSTKQK